jgi:hypothetical protein
MHNYQNHTIKVNEKRALEDCGCKIGLVHNHQHTDLAKQ